MTETESTTPDDDAVAQLLELLRDRLAEALRRAVLAHVSISAEEIEAAVGSLAGLDLDLADAAALHRSIVLLSQRALRSVPPSPSASD